MPRGVAVETPAFSPDGRFLAYVTTHAGERPQLWIANGDGTGARRVRAVPGDDRRLEPPVATCSP